MSGCLKFIYEALKRTAPKRITLNWTVQKQTKACIAKSPCEICAVLQYYAV